MAEKKSTPEFVVNDFSITVGTVNGSGSQTANLTLMRAIFKMGIPVSGKNIFPSNIQGLPTWYTIRVNKNGYLARSETTEVVVAMNPVSFADDLDKLSPGGLFLYADHIRQEVHRNDVIVCEMPVKKLVREADAPRNLRDYVANMVYVGVLAHLLNIDVEKLQEALSFHFGGKEKPIKLNMNVVEKAIQWAAENFDQTSPYCVEPMAGTEGYIMAKGNTAGALGAIYGGLQFTAWYPITPATGLPEALIKYRPLVQKDDKKMKEQGGISMLSFRRKMSWPLWGWLLALDGLVYARLQPLRGRG